jgi:hypothetical protein
LPNTTRLVLQEVALDMRIQWVQVLAVMMGLDPV